MIVALPAFLATTFPFLDTVATDFLLLDHLGFFFVPFTFNVLDCPTVSIIFELEILIFDFALTDSKFPKTPSVTASKNIVNNL